MDPAINPKNQDLTGKHFIKSLKEENLQRGFEAYLPPRAEAKLEMKEGFYDLMGLWVEINSPK